MLLPQAIYNVYNTHTHTHTHTHTMCILLHVACSSILYVACTNLALNSHLNAYKFPDKLKFMHIPRIPKTICN